jgi:hypothetical protein
MPLGLSNMLLSQDMVYEGLINSGFNFEFFKELKGMGFKVDTSYFVNDKLLTEESAKEKSKNYDLSIQIQSLFQKYPSINDSTDLSFNLTNLKPIVTIDFLGIPLSSNFDILLVDGKYSNMFSNYTLGVDHDKLLDNYKKKIIGEKEKLVLPKIEKNHLEKAYNDAKRNESDVQFLTKIFADSNFYYLVDSISKNQDSLGYNVKDSTSIEILEKLVKLEKKYRDLWKNRNKANQIISRYEEGIENLNSFYDSLNDPNILKEKIKSSNAFNSFDKLLVGVKRFGYGLINIQNESLPFNFIPLDGGFIEYEVENYNFQVGYGSLSPSSYTSLFTDLELKDQKVRSKNKVFYSKATFGKDLEKLEFQFLSFVNEDPGNIFNDLPAYNYVLGLNGTEKIGQRLFVSGEFSISNQDYFDQDYRGYQSKILDNIYLESKVGWQSSNNNYTVSTGVFKSGLNFYSVGNPFQVINKRGILIDLSGKFLSKRLSLRMRFNLGRPDDENFKIGNQSSNIQILGQGTLKVSKSGLININISPNRSYRNINGNDQKSEISNNIYSISYSDRVKIKDKDVLLNCSVTNSNNNFDFIDTSFVLNNWNFGFVSDFGFSSKLNLNLRANLITDGINTGSIIECIMDSRHKNYSFGIGPQYLKRFGRSENQIGARANFSYKMEKLGSLIISGLFRNGLSNHNGREFEFFCNTGININF